MSCHRLSGLGVGGIAGRRPAALAYVPLAAAPRRGSSAAASNMLADRPRGMMKPVLAVDWRLSIRRLARSPAETAAGSSRLSMSPPRFRRARLSRPRGAEATARRGDNDLEVRPAE